MYSTYFQIPKAYEFRVHLYWSKCGRDSDFSTHMRERRLTNNSSARRWPPPTVTHTLQENCIFLLGREGKSAKRGQYMPIKEERATCATYINRNQKMA